MAKKIDWAFAGNLNVSADLLDYLKREGFVPNCVFANSLGADHEKNSGLKQFCQSNDIDFVVSSDIADQVDRLQGIAFLFLHRFSLIKNTVYSAPKFGAFNLHFSLLPEYRGVHPVAWAIIRGEKRTGITIHKIDSGTDTGDIALQSECEISLTDSIWSLTEKLETLSQKATAQFFKYLEIYGCPPPLKPQLKVNKPFYARRRSPLDGKIHWPSMSSLEIHNLIRALHFPLPNAFAHLSDGKLVEFKTSSLTSVSDYNGVRVGGIFKVIGEHKYLIRTIDSAIEVETNIKLNDGVWIT